MKGKRAHERKPTRFSFVPVHHTFGPHVDATFLRRTLAVSYVPWKYRRGESVERLRKALTDRFGGSAALFATGREALLALLRTIDLKAGEEVIVQGYTCVVVPNAIHAAGDVPVYADISPDTLNLTAETVETLITPRTRAVICQHTFGIPSETKALAALCDERSLLLIEDCAHVLPDETGPSEIGTLGDALILSFGRDKAISGISGGAVIVKSESAASGLKIREAQAADMSWWRVMTLLEYATRMRSIVRPLLWTGLHRPILAVLNRIGFYAPILTKEEREGAMSPVVRKIPNACATLALFSLSRLRRVNDHRRRLTELYLQHGTHKHWPMLGGVHSGLPLQKFPIFVPGADGKRAALKRQNIHLNDGWTGCVICPDTVDGEAAGYETGTDPTAENACRKILSLPTHPTMTFEQAERLCSVIDGLLKADGKA